MDSVRAGRSQRGCKQKGVSKMRAADGWGGRRSPARRAAQVCMPRCAACPGALHAPVPCGWRWPCCAAGHCPGQPPPAPRNAAAPSTASLRATRPGMPGAPRDRGVFLLFWKEKIAWLHFVAIIFPVALRSCYICTGLAAENTVSWFQRKRLGISTVRTEVT